MCVVITNTPLRFVQIVSDTPKWTFKRDEATEMPESQATAVAKQVRGLVVAVLDMSEVAEIRDGEF